MPHLEPLRVAFRAVDPRVRLVPARLVRRVVRARHTLLGVGPALHVPHEFAYALPASALRELASADEIVMPKGTPEEPDPVVRLLSAPEADGLARRGVERTLGDLWRALVHLEVHVALDRRIVTLHAPPPQAAAPPTVSGAAEATDPDPLDDAGLDRRIDRLVGQAPFDEIRSVLRDEDRLLPPPDTRAVWVEFAATFLELRAFAPGQVARWFPTLADPAAVEAALVRDLGLPVGADASAALLAFAERLRPAGAPDPPSLLEATSAASPPPGPAPGEPHARAHQRRLARSQRRLGRGRPDRVGAALDAAQASRLAPDAAARASADASLCDAVDALAVGLAAATPDATLPSGEPLTSDAWATALTPLARAAAAAPTRMPPPARALYDLQRALDARAKVPLAGDLIGGLLRRRPLIRPLPLAQPLAALRHLHRAQARLPLAELAHDPGTSTQLSAALHATADASERAFRADLRPRLRRALAAEGLACADGLPAATPRPRHLAPDISTPSPAPLTVARDALVERLLDRAVARGYLALGDLRDGLAEGDLKVPDLQSPRELTRGDPLLRADAALSRELDGVYRAGEGYLRGLLRLSAVAFGTAFGRALVRHAVLPFGGAFVVLEGLQHLVVPLLGMVGLPQPRLLQLGPFLALSAVLLALVVSPTARMVTSRGVRATGRTLRTLLIGWPVRVLSTRLAQRIVRSGWFRWLLRLVVGPVIWATLVWVALLAGGVPWDTAGLVFIASWVTLAVALTTRPGRDVEERVVDATTRAWRRARHEFLPGLFRWVMGGFKAAMSWLERTLYRVDAWLRVRRGDRRTTVALKVLGGPPLRAVGYVVRLYVTLLIEPQVNPIKHFPVVTVAHKLMLPFLPAITEALMMPLAPLGQAMAATLAGGTVFLLPGVFGFLAWELQANWRLYAANRRPELYPVRIGHHGETLVGFLRPGFHSGTLPKAYRRLRRAEASGRAAAASHHTLDDVAHDVARFVDRELGGLLALSADFPGTVRTAGVTTGSNRIRVTVALAADAAPFGHAPVPTIGPPVSASVSALPAVIGFEEQSGHVVAGFVVPGFVADLPGPARVVFARALTGLYKKAGVDLVRETLEAWLGDVAAYDIADEGLLVWPARGFEAEATYPLAPNRKGFLEPQVTRADAPTALPVLAADAVVFARQRVLWERWLEAWDPKPTQGAGPPGQTDPWASKPVAALPTGLDPRAWVLPSAGVTPLPPEGGTAA